MNSMGTHKLEYLWAVAFLMAKGPVALLALPALAYVAWEAYQARSRPEVWKEKRERLDAQLFV
jgi:hypothetical protein